MRKSLRKVLCLALAASMVMGLSGCTTYNNFKNAFFSDGKVATERTIKIGIYEPVTGQYKEQGKAEIAGIELANKLYPEVLGKKVELVYADNKSNMYDGETARQELLSNSPSVVLGSYGETLTLAASDYIKATNTPAITISSTNPLITVNNSYYFSAAYTETRQGDALADFAYTSQKKDIAVTVKFANDDTATATIKRFTNRIKKLTGSSKSAAGNFEISTDSQDYSETIEKIRSSGAKAVFLALPSGSAKYFMEQCVKNNLTHVLFLGTRSWNDKDLLKYVQSEKKLNVAFCGEQSQANETELSKIFMEAYKTEYGEDAEPEGSTAVAFDAYVMALKAIEDAYNNLLTSDVEELAAQAKSDAEAKAIKDAYQKAMDEGIPTGTQIRDALNQIEDFQGASGVINYGGNNEPTKSVSINHIQAGNEMPVYVVK